MRALGLRLQGIIYLVANPEVNSRAGERIDRCSGL